MDWWKGGGFENYCSMCMLRITDEVCISDTIATKETSLLVNIPFLRPHSCTSKAKGCRNPRSGNWQRLRSPTACVRLSHVSLISVYLGFARKVRLPLSTPSRYAPSLTRCRNRVDSFPRTISSFFFSKFFFLCIISSTSQAHQTTTQSTSPICVSIHCGYICRLL